MNIRHFIWLIGIAAGTTAAAQDNVILTQTTDSMKTEKKERVAVRTYKATENAFVKGYEAVEDGCVKMFAHKGETTEETKACLQAGVEKSHDISAEAQERSHAIAEEAQQRSREISQKATGAKAKKLILIIVTPPRPNSSFRWGHRWKDGSEQKSISTKQDKRIIGYW